MPKLIVVGATGVLGNATTKLFVKNNITVKALVRNKQKATGLSDAGVEIVEADLARPQSLQNILTSDDIVLAAAHSMMGKGANSSGVVDNKGHKALIDEAVKAGVQQFIYCSAYGASPDHPVDFFRTKYEVEQYLVKSGLRYTILRPAAFMEWHMHNLLGKGMVEKGKTMLFGKGENPTSFIAADDVAQLVLRVFNNEEFYNTTIDITGPDDLTKKEVAALYAKYLNSNAAVKHVPRAALKVFSFLLKPFHPGLSRIMKLSLHADTQNSTMEKNASIQRFGITPTKAEDFIKAQVLNATR